RMTDNGQESMAVRRRQRLAEQPRLADPGLAVDEQCGAGTATRGTGAADERQLCGPAGELQPASPRRRLLHGGVNYTHPLCALRHARDRRDRTVARCGGDQRRRAFALPRRSRSSGADPRRNEGGPEMTKPRAVRVAAAIAIAGLGYGLLPTGVVHAAE